MKESKSRIEPAKAGARAVDGEVSAGGPPEEITHTGVTTAWVDPQASVEATRPNVAAPEGSEDTRPNARQPEEPGELTLPNAEYPASVAEPTHPSAVPPAEPTHPNAVPPAEPTLPNAAVVAERPEITHPDVRPGGLSDPDKTHVDASTAELTPSERTDPEVLLEAASEVERTQPNVGIDLATAVALRAAEGAARRLRTKDLSDAFDTEGPAQPSERMVRTDPRVRPLENEPTQVDPPSTDLPPLPPDDRPTRDMSMHAKAERAPATAPESLPLPPSDMKSLLHSELTPTAPGSGNGRSLPTPNRDGSTQVVSRPSRAAPPVEEATMLVRRGAQGAKPAPANTSAGQEESTMLVDRARLETTGPITSPHPPRRRGVGVGLYAVAAVLLACSVALLGYKQSWWSLPWADRLPVLSQVADSRNREFDSLLAEAQRAADQKRWNEVTMLANAALMMRPEHEGAMQLAIAAADAARAAPLTAAEAAVAQEDWREADRELAVIPEGERDARWKVLRAKVDTGLRTLLQNEINGHLAAGRLEEAESVLGELEAADAPESMLQGLRDQLDDKLAAKDGQKGGRGNKRTTPGTTARKPDRKAESETLYREGQLLLNGGQDDPARRKLEKAVKLNPRHALAHRSLGIVFVRLGDREQAAQHYERYVELRPNAPEAAQIRDMLARYRSR